MTDLVLEENTPVNMLSREFEQLASFEKSENPTPTRSGFKEGFHYLPSGGWQNRQLVDGTSRQSTNLNALTTQTVGQKRSVRGSLLRATCDSIQGSTILEGEQPWKFETKQNAW